jgi:hypothetical protein
VVARIERQLLLLVAHIVAGVGAMVNKSSYERSQTIAVDRAKVSKRGFRICIHCNDAHMRFPGVVEAPLHLRDRRETIQSHLKKCRWYDEARAMGSVLPLDDAVRQWGARQGQMSVASFLHKRPSTSSGPSRLPSDSSSTTSSDKRHQRQIDNYYTPLFSDDKREEFERLLIEFQAENFLPTSFIEKGSTKRLLKFLNSASVRAMPTRHALRTRILDKYSLTGDQSSREVLLERQQSTGGRVNLLSDVWQNVAKKHMLGCHFGLFGTIVNYGLFPTTSRHDGIAIAQQLEAIIEGANLESWRIGAIVTDNAGQCGRARRILALRWPGMAMIHCFAHDINNLVKAILRTAFSAITKKASAVITALNASSSKWLPLAKKEIIATYGTPLSFVMLCETRWNSMQGCFASLLRVKSALIAFTMKYRDDPDFPNAARVFYENSNGENMHFWDDLKAAEEVIHPLAHASYKLQRDENTLADVVTCYRSIFEGFSANFEFLELASLIERRWRQCEQPLMLLTLFVHPMHVLLARALVDDIASALRFERLCSYAVYYYRRFVDDDTQGLRGDILSWYKGDFVNATIADFNGNIVMFWDYAKHAQHGSKLPRLAIILLSISVNTATCERYFSELAAIHTAKRNRLAPERAHKFSILRQRMRETNEEKDQEPKKPPKRLINPHERPKISDSSPVLVLDEADDITVASEIPEAECEDMLEYWQEILDVLDESADTDSDELDDDNFDDEPVLELFGSEDDVIPPPDRRPFPDFNTPNFSQEHQLPGIRGDKYPLILLFPQSTMGMGPYVSALTP